MPKTKIICTIGPSSSDSSIMRKMMLSGMDAARLNFSHGNHEIHKSSIDLIRQLNAKYKRSVKILQDLEGYRIRIGRFKGAKEVELKKKDTVVLTNKNILGDGGTIPFDYAGNLGAIKNGKFIYIDDGNIALQVKSRQKNILKAEVIVGGILKENKGVNIPDVPLSFKGLTDKDKSDIVFAEKNKVDFIAQSFVRDKEDILEVREFLGGRLAACKIIAKIENRQGIQNLDGILDVSDGIMVARGDMGVSVPIYEVPMLQKLIIRKCNHRKKFVITATQMLETMTENLRPTRSEVSDVANAVLDGSDFVMLSAETAAGKHPVEAVKMMNEVIKFTENSARRGLDNLKY